VDVPQGDAGVAFRLLGPISAVDASGAAVALGPSRQRALLAGLLVGDRVPVSVAQLVDLLWDSRPPPTAATMVHASIAGLRKALEPGRRSGAARLLVTRDGGYVLQVSPEEIDAVRFERLLAEGRRAVRAAPERARRVLVEALDLWTGPALAGVDQAFARDAAGRLDDLRVGCAELKAEAGLVLGLHHEVASELVALVARSPLRESLSRLLMVALYRCGRQSEALATCAHLRRSLVMELGVDPGPETRRLELGMLRQSAELECPATTVARSGRSRAVLPAPMSEFLGRNREQPEVAALLARHRLVTLTGPGGAGKTRLAVEVAQRLTDRTGAEAFFVDLTPLAAGAGIEETVASALDVRAEPGQELLGTVAAALDGRDSVIVLDNCEHLLERCATLVASLLARTGQARVLATSREPLGLAGEHLHVVRPLPLASPDDPWDRIAACEAVRLFANRAAAVRPGFVVTPENARLVLDVCARLDGLPLALELAAARAASMPLRDLAARLDDRFRLLAAAARPVDPRHRSLAATVRWTYDLLTGPERALLGRITVFPATFDLAAAQALVGDEGHATGDGLLTLSRLVACSTVQLEEEPDGEPRYRLLETTRQFAREQMNGAELDRLRARHARHYLSVAEQAGRRLFRAGAGPWLARLHRERANLLAALAWAFEPDGDADVGARLVGCLWHYWDLRGARSEGLHWVHTALDAVGADPAVRRLPLLSAGALLHMGGAEFDATTELAAELLTLARRSGHRAWKGDALSMLATIAWARGRFDRAQQLYEDAIAAALAGGGVWRAAMAEAQLARLHRDRNEPDAARAVALRSLAHAQQVGEELAHGLALDVLASIEHRWGALAEARRLIEEALVHYRLVDYREGEASALQLVGRIRLGAGEPERARVAFERSLLLCQQIGHRAGTAAALEGLADATTTTAAIEAAGVVAGRLRAAASALRAEIGVPRPGS
jgi:predicted ATPase/DNA-binding SARP family transcriptional activator